MDTKFFSFKRFVTFGLGLGIFMSAASGFAQNDITLPANNTITGTATSGNGTITVDAANIGSIILNDAVTIKSNNTNAAALTIDMSGNSNGILMGSPTNQLFKVDRLGDLTATKLNANSLTMSNGGTISGSAQVVTIDALDNGNVVIKDQTKIEGSLTVNQTISSSQAIQTTGTGSISSAYNLSAAGNKFNVAGNTGNVHTNGTLSVQMGSFEVTSTGMTKANNGLAVTGSGGLKVNGTAFEVDLNGDTRTKGSMSITNKMTAGSIETTNKQFTVNGTTGAVETKAGITAAGTQFNVNGSNGSVGVGVGDKIYLNGTNGNATITGVTLANGGLYVGTRKDSPAGQPSLQVNGQGSVSTGATDINGNVGADGTIIANGNDLTRIAKKAENAITATNSRVATVEGKTLNMTSSVDSTTFTGSIAATSGTVTTGATTVGVNGVAITNGTAIANGTDLVNMRNEGKSYVASQVVTLATKENLNTTNQNLVAEENKRIAEDIRVLNQANTYTDQQVQAQSQQDRAYTNQQVSNERDRAMAVEANLQKQINAVGAMSMATAAINTAPTQGDKKTQIGVGVGSYGGSSAVAVGLSHSTEGDVNNMSGGKTRVYVRYTATVSKGSGGRTGVGAGMTFGF